jgi:hypothetical protein
MLLYSFDPTIDVETVIAPMPRTTLEVICFDELGGKRDGVYKSAEAKESLFVPNRFIVEVERCE